MPPDTFTWDRKELLRDRKHERSSEPHHYSYPHGHPHQHQISRGGGGGGYGGVSGTNGGGTRWREHQHLPSNPHHPYNHPSPRWISDGRDRAGQPGYGKQGGLVPSRSSDKFSVDESFRASGSLKFSRNNREIRSSVCQKERKGQNAEAAPSLGGSDRLDGVIDVQPKPKLVVEVLSDSLNPQPDLTDLKNGIINGNVSGSTKSEKENLLSPVDWKCIKWTRSGSLPSRGPSLCQSNSSRSMGSLSNVTKNEAHEINVTPIQSSSCDAATGIAVSPAFLESLSSPSEETSSRKKPRLGWGEGLAKYEKKKIVVGVDDFETKNGFVCDSKEDQPCVGHTVKALSKCPIPPQSVDCATPDPLSAIDFSCTTGIEEKQSIKVSGFEHEAANFCVSPNIAPQNHVEKSTFNLENLDLNSIACLSSSIDTLLLSDIPVFGDSGYVRSTAMKKLSVWKGEVLKAIEITESEIDSHEGRLKTMTEPVPTRPTGLLQRSASSSLSSSYPSKASGNDDGVVDSIQHEMPSSLEVQDVNVKGDEIESPGSATSKLINMPFSQHEDRVDNSSKKTECSTKIVNDHHVEYYDGLQIVVSDFSNYSSDKVDMLHESIWASNKDAANEAVEELNRYLPDKEVAFDIPSYVENSEMIKAKLLRKKRFQQFKERFVALKFKALQHNWKEDVRFLYSKKYCYKSQKKFENSSRALPSSHQKHNSALRSGFSIHGAGKLSLTTPNAKTIKFVRKLVSNSQLQPLRPELKMPSLILDNKEKFMRFVSLNGMVEDPVAIEKQRSMENYWTEEERKIFIDNLAEFGKDFTKIASFLTHKTTADCIEFYYKNHKSDFFMKAKKKNPDSVNKEGKNCLNENYLVTSEKRLILEANAASLDILGAASEIAANAKEFEEHQQKIASRNITGISSCLDVDDNERETVAADVLAGICSSLSSEAMGSCITGTVGIGEGYYELLDVDETCSDDNCKETDLIDWTDEEKSVFMQAMLTNESDFDTISKCVHTRSKDQCKIFFSKARTILGLDGICSGGDHVVEETGVDTGSYACVIADSGNIEVDLPSPDSKSNVEPGSNGLEENDATSNFELIDQPGHLINDSQIKPDSGTMEVNLPSPDLKSNIEQDDVNDDAISDSSHLIFDAHVDSEDVCDQGSKPVAVQNECSIEAVPYVGEASNVCDIPDKPHESMVSEIRMSSIGYKDDDYQTDNDARLKSCATNDVVSICDQQVNNHISRYALLGNSESLDVNGKLDSFKGIRLGDMNSRHHDQLSESINPFNSFEQHINPCSRLDGSFGVENSESSGNVKLFGQIITNPCNKKSSSLLQQRTENENHPRVARNFSFRSTEDLNQLGYSGRVTDKNASQVTSYGFWDGNRIQTGFSSLPNTAVLMSTGFGNHHLQSHVLNNGRTRNFNGLSRDLQPLSLQQRQEIMLLELQRRKAMETVTVVQQTTAMGGIVGINSGIVGQCSGVSDPVAAIRMQYGGLSEQFTGQTVNIISKDESWRGVSR